MFPRPMRLAAWSDAACTDFRLAAHDTSSAQVHRRHPRAARPAATTSPSAASPPRCSSPCAWGGRCSWKAKPAWARPRSPRCWPQTLGRQLVRLQCYEGLDIASAVYEWNYPRQMIEIRLAEAAGGTSREALGPGHLLRTLPDPPSAAAGARRRSGRGAGAADRRAGPHRRAVRGLSARGAVRLPDHHPGDRHDQGSAAADRRPHLQPHARDPRRGQAALPVPLGRLSLGAQRELDILARKVPGAPERLSRGGRRLRAEAARHGPVQAAGRRRDHRLVAARWWSSTASRSTRRSSTTPWARCSSIRTTSPASRAARPRASSRNCARSWAPRDLHKPAIENTEISVMEKRSLPCVRRTRGRVWGGGGSQGEGAAHKASPNRSFILINPSHSSK